MKYISLMLLALTAASCGQGPQGERGEPGGPGASCTLTVLPITQEMPDGGALIKCPDGTEFQVINDLTDDSEEVPVVHNKKPKKDKE